MRSTLFIAPLLAATVIGGGAITFAPIAGATTPVCSEDQVPGADDCNAGGPQGPWQYKTLTDPGDPGSTATAGGTHPLVPGGEGADPFVSGGPGADPLIPASTGANPFVPLDTGADPFVPVGPAL